MIRMIANAKFYNMLVYISHRLPDAFLFIVRVFSLYYVAKL